MDLKLQLQKLTKLADIIMILRHQTEIQDIYKDEIAPNLSASSASSWFATWFQYTLSLCKAPEDVDVLS